MNNRYLFIATVVVFVLVGALSASLASVAMLLFTLFVGFLFTRIIANNNKEKNLLMSAFLFSFVLVTFMATLQWLSINNDWISFADDNNDHFKFFLASQDGAQAPSINSIFNDCILGGIYWENGGYYFLIQLIAYIANTVLDGNCILLQQLGSTAFFVWSSIFLSKTLMHFCPIDKVRYYTFFYVAFCPLILHSLGIHRDVHVAFFYMVLIYITLCKKVNVVTISLQLLIAFVLFYFREQHGLFAISFIGLSLLLSQGRSKWMILIVVLGIFAVFGLTMVYNFIGSNLADTNDYYNAYRNAQLSGLDSGLGRYVYMLPTPLRELAQIIVLQMRFPPWGMLEGARNPYAFIIGIEGLLVAFLWFYVFICILSFLFRYRFSQLPKSLRYGIIMILVFLLLNSSNLDSRRVVCMYPFIFIPYVYMKEFVAKKYFIKSLNKRYIGFYVSLCFVYLLFSLIIG